MYEEAMAKRAQTAAKRAQTAAKRAQDAAKRAQEVMELAQASEMEAQNEIRNLNGLLEVRDERIALLEKELGELEEQTEKAFSLLKEKNVELEDRMKYEMRRASQALEVADNAAQAAGSVARIANSINMTIQALETKLDLDNRESRR